LDADALARHSPLQWSFGEGTLLITKPSISDLLAGLVRNLEHTAEDHTADPRLLLRPALAVLDRVASEWFGWRAMLEADNADIRETLQCLDCAPTSAARRDATLHDVQCLEEENRLLKQALVEAIEAFDLPAAAGACAAVREADAAVLALLRRMLRREASIETPPPRSVSTSGNPASAAVPLDQLGGVLKRFLAAQMPAARHIRIEDLQPLAGGASREAWVFDVRWRDSGGDRFEPCILMREPIASVLVSDDGPDVINGTRRTVATEVRVVRAMERAGLPVPVMLWQDPTGQWLDRPFSVARRLPGSADAAGLIGSEHVERLLDQYIDILGRLHRLDPNEVGLEFLGMPTQESAALEQVEQYERNFHGQRLEAFPATTYIIRWLKKHCPRARHIGVVHGDYRLGNFLYESDRLVAVLDWEQVHVGDPVEEIAFMYWSAWSLEAICPIEDFLRRYEAAVGRDVDRQALAYYRAFIEFKMLVVLFTGLKSFYATPEGQLHYASPQATEMIRDSQLRVIEALCQGGPTVAFDAYRKG
jgi:aminoglycoside phosphotransferase (APT) family kinase protein